MNTHNDCFKICSGYRTRPCTDSVGDYHATIAPNPYVWTKQDSNLHGHGFNVMLYHWSYSSVLAKRVRLKGEKEESFFTLFSLQLFVSALFCYHLHCYYKALLASHSCTLCSLCSNYQLHPSSIISCGERGIRTPSPYEGRRFSRPLHLTTLPSLHV